jgi:phosphatidylglycerol:prolipoprotein diacylglycerol transferase
MLVPGIIGARAFYVIEYWPEYWRTYTEPGGGPGPFVAAVLSVNKGGLVVYGAFFGGVTGLLLFVRKHRLPLLALCDLIAPSMMLGLALGRIGCLLNGCCFGSECAHAWAVTFPGPSPAAPQGSPAYLSQVGRGRLLGMLLGGRDLQAEPVLKWVDPASPAGRAGLQAGDRLQSISGRPVNTSAEAQAVLRDLFVSQKPVVLQARGHGPVDVGPMPVDPRSRKVHPTQIYGSINALLLCLLLLAYDPFCRRDGELFALMISVYPVTRFLLEMLRDDEPWKWHTGMTIAQNVSLGVLVCAVGLWLYILRRPRGRAFFQR